MPKGIHTILALGLIGLACAPRSRAPLMPKADPARFSVAIADLEGDAAGDMKRKILVGLLNLQEETERKGKNHKMEGMLVLDVPRVIPLGRTGAPMIGVERGHTLARAILKETGASVLLWGQVLVYDGRTAPALYMTVAQNRQHERRSGTYMVEFGLPVQFWSDLGDVLQLLVITQASMFFELRGQYIAGQVGPFIRKVEALTRSTVFEDNWTDDSRGKVHAVLGSAWLILGEQAGDNQALANAVTAYEAATVSLTRERVSLDWATTQNGLGNALQALGEREPGTTRLKQSIIAYRSALSVLTRECVPFAWASVQNNLGNALLMLGRREQGTSQLEQSVAAFRLALQERTRENAPLDWAATQNNLGLALFTLGKRERGTKRLEQAVVAFRSALQVQTRERVPLDWARTQNNLGNALRALGEREQGTERLEQAVGAFRSALHVQSRKHMPLDWAMTQNNLGAVLAVLGQRTQEPEYLKQAVGAFRSALQERTRLRAPRAWAMTQHNLGTALLLLGQREQGTERLEQAVVALRSALQVLVRAHFRFDWAMIHISLGSAMTLLALRTGVALQLCEALEAYLSAWDVFRDDSPHYAKIAASGVFWDLQVMWDKSLPVSACSPNVAALTNNFLHTTMPPSP